MSDPGFFETAKSLLVVAGGAFAVPLLARRIKLPASVGEILFGVLVGVEVLNLVRPAEFIDLTAELGFLLLMFIAGLELDFRKLEAGGIKPLVHGVGVTLSVFVMAMLAAVALGFDPFLGLVAGAISIGVPLVVLQETGLAKTPFGQNLMLVGSIGEFSSILLVTGVSAYDHARGINGVFATHVGEMALIFFGAYIVLVILRTLVWWRSESFSRVVESHDPSEIGVRGGLFLMFFFVAVAAKFQIDPILGSFLAGALFSFVFRGKGPLELKFMSIGNGFFVPFFFISVGMHFSIEKARGGDLLLLLELLVILVTVRVLAFLLVPKEDKTTLIGVGMGILLSAPLTLLVVVANLGRKLGKIDEVMFATVILLAVLSSTIYPWLFKLLVPKIKATPEGQTGINGD
ncbi:MAG: cation:proton antiporter [Vulcanimicrobiota bacterium]